MKIVVITLFSIFSILICFGVYSFSKQAKLLEKEYADISKVLEKAQAERAATERDATYYARPENVEKELRGVLNYKYPGEKTIILVAPTTTSTKP